MRSNKGFTLIELLIVVAIIGIMRRSRCPGSCAPDVRQRGVGDRVAALGQLGGVDLLVGLRRGGYAQSLPDLGTPPVGGGQAFISPDLGIQGGPAVALKSGYNVQVNNDGSAQMLAQACNNVPSFGEYFAAADPLTFGTTGNRHFGTDERATVWQDTADNPFAAAPRWSSRHVAPIQ